MENKTKIATVRVGDTGHPGDRFRVLDLTLYRTWDGPYEMRAVLRAGSNQGSLEVHEEKTYRARGRVLDQAKRLLEDDAMALASGSITPSDLRSGLRDLVYEADDEINRLIRQEIEGIESVGLAYFGVLPRAEFWRGLVEDWRTPRVPEVRETLESGHFADTLIGAIRSAIAETLRPPELPENAAVDMRFAGDREEEEAEADDEHN